MKGNDTEINGFMEIYGLINPLDRFVKSNAPGLVVKDCEKKDQEGINCNGDKKKVFYSGNLEED